MKRKNLLTECTSVELRWTSYWNSLKSEGEHMHDTDSVLESNPQKFT